MTTIFLHISLFLIFCVFVEINSHGMMLEPPNRSSIWRFPEFRKYKPTINNNDNENFCGGFEVQYDVNKGFCGICGDAFNQSHPRDNEDGGKFSNGITVRRYKAGQVIPVHVNITTNHWGYFELRLCARSDIESHLNQSCYDEHLLELVGYRRTQISRWYLTNPRNSTIKSPYNPKETEFTPYNARPNRKTKFYIDSDEHTLFYKFRVRLPQNVKCKYCVLQWNWRTANNYGYCHGNTYQRGCGPQETFRGCADIAIY